MCKKVASMVLMAMLMVACDPTVECTRKVGKPNTNYVVTLVDSNGTFASAVPVESSNSSEITVKKPCSSIGDITEGNSK